MYSGTMELFVGDPLKEPLFISDTVACSCSRQIPDFIGLRCGTIYCTIPPP